MIFKQSKNTIFCLSFINQINNFLSLIDFLMKIYDSTNNFIEENLFRRQREKEFERESI